MIMLLFNTLYSRWQRNPITDLTHRIDGVDFLLFSKQSTLSCLRICVLVLLIVNVKQKGLLFSIICYKSGALLMVVYAGKWYCSNKLTIVYSGVFNLFCFYLFKQNFDVFSNKLMPHLNSVTSYKVKRVLAYCSSLYTNDFVYFAYRLSLNFVGNESGGQLIRCDHSVRGHLSCLDYCWAEMSWHLRQSSYFYSSWSR